MVKTKKKTFDVLELIRREVGDDPEYWAMVEEERFNAWIAQRIYEMRTAAGLTQEQLAARVNTRQSVISRLEDADYEGHSLDMLRRIAAALGRRLELRFAPRGRSAQRIARARSTSRRT
jgi:ribosome-binding protein aMBF1 (putative translation factor)